MTGSSIACAQRAETSAWKEKELASGDAVPLDAADEGLETWDFGGRELAALDLAGVELAGDEEDGCWDVALPTYERRSVERRASVSRERRAEGSSSTMRPGHKGKLVAVVAILGAAVLGITTQTLHSSFAAPQQVGNLNYHWQSGYYQDNGWLCYGWANGAYHCTAHWHMSGSTAISDNPAWVPNGGSSSSTVKLSTSAPNSCASSRPAPPSLLSLPAAG